MNKELELGKRYNWEEIVEAYPGMWVRMSDCNLTIGSDIIDGILLGIYTDRDVAPVQIKMWHEKSKDELQRTTYDMNIGVIECLNAEMEVKDEP
ncbi:MAG: hypothetical protein OSJ45_08620 [Lachnospiraceae bacterium]|nr:hypothetical protein [Lachnospiraceae bacterium]